VQVIAFIAIFVVFWRDMTDLFRDRSYRSIMLWMSILLVAGVIFYRSVEGWSLLDSLYFCVMTLATVGFGDLAPTTPVSKLFTIVYVFFGLSFFVTFVSLLTKDRQEIFAKRKQELQSGDKK
jgi:voltage-gated potassium channel